MKLWEIMGELHTIFSPRIAEDWDNVGLLIGDNTREVNKVLFCLDVTEKVVQKAIDKNYRLFSGKISWKGELLDEYVFI